MEKQMEQNKKKTIDKVGTILLIVHLHIMEQQRLILNFWKKMNQKNGLYIFHLLISEQNLDNLL
mgnify:CR=1 FL=1